MQIKRAFKCPQCGGEFDKCRPSGRGRIFALCINCGLVVFLEDYQIWQRRMQKIANLKYCGAPISFKKDEEIKKNLKKPEKKFNPTER